MPTIGNFNAWKFKGMFDNVVLVTLFVFFENRYR